MAVPPTAYSVRMESGRAQCDRPALSLQQSFRWPERGGSSAVACQRTGVECQLETWRSSLLRERGQQHRLSPAQALLSPGVGADFKLGSWQLGPHLRWYAPYEDTTLAVLTYPAPGKRGAIGVGFTLSRRFGGQ